MGAVLLSFKGHEYPVEVTFHSVWLYFRFPLPVREVEELMLERGTEQRRAIRVEMFCRTAATGSRSRMMTLRRTSVATTDQRRVRAVDGVDYAQVVTERLERSPQSVVREVLGERPSGGVLQKMREGRDSDRGVLHAPDCEEAPQGAPLHDVDRALDVAEHPSTRLCTQCGAAQQLTPLLRGFDHIDDT